jgi:hypothetical protein
MSILTSALISSFVLINAPEEGASAAAEPAPASDDGKVRTKEWQLKVAPGAEFFVFPWVTGPADNPLIAAGPAAKLSAHRIGWYGGFMVGGGPSLHYSFMKETKDPPDRLHWLTLNGDFIIGGGRYEKFAVYGHLMLGAGIFSGYDAETDAKLKVLPTGRALVGVGGYGHITKRVSLGLLADFGFPGTIDALITATFHFGKKK